MGWRGGEWVGLDLGCSPVECLNEYHLPTRFKERILALFGPCVHGDTHIFFITVSVLPHMIAKMNDGSILIVQFFFLSFILSFLGLSALSRSS